MYLLRAVSGHLAATSAAMHMRKSENLQAGIDVTAVHVQARRAEALAEAAGQDLSDTQPPSPGDEVCTSGPHGHGTDLTHILNGSER